MHTIIVVVSQSAIPRLTAASIFLVEDPSKTGVQRCSKVTAGVEQKTRQRANVFSFVHDLAREAFSFDGTGCTSRHSRGFLYTSRRTAAGVTGFDLKNLFKCFGRFAGNLWYSRDSRKYMIHLLSFSKLTSGPRPRNPLHFHDSLNSTLLVQSYFRCSEPPLAPMIQAADVATQVSFVMMYIFMRS